MIDRSVGSGTSQRYAMREISECLSSLALSFSQSRFCCHKPCSALTCFAPIQIQRSTGITQDTMKQFHLKIHKQLFYDAVSMNNRRLILVTSTLNLDRFVIPIRVRKNGMSDRSPGCESLHRLVRSHASRDFRRVQSCFIQDMRHMEIGQKTSSN